MKMKSTLALMLAGVLSAGLLAGCSSSSSSTAASTAGGTSSTVSATGEAAEISSGEGQVYFFNFKPEQDEQYQEIAAFYTEQTGVPVKVVTAASGTYEQQLRSEIAKNDAPTIFQVNGPVGYSNWKDYTYDLSGTELYSHLSDESMAITGADGGVYAIPFALEGYGIIVNNKIMATYFETDGAVVASLEEINNFETLQAVVEDMTAKKDDLGIEGVFASTSLMPGEDWRWQTHLSNVPLYYEWKNEGTDLSDLANTATINFTYNENFKNIFDLYLNNSTIASTMVGSKTVDDSMAEFALGSAAMVQNGNWAYGQISGIDGNVVAAEDVSFLPIYTGMEGEESQGLCIGTENYFCINKNASEEDIQASIEFLTWLYTSSEGKNYVTNLLGFIAPFDTFTDADKPSDPLGQQVMEWSTREDVENVAWNFTVYPSQQFKDDFGGNLLLYAQGQMEWADVVSAMVESWANEKAATAE